jgi:ribulose-5-phosphate 4-epimerase/fuculose-1-phosphate aldolase
MQALRFHARLAYHEFEGPAVEEGERRRLAEHLGNFDAMILRNHGLLTCGRTIAEAFLLMQRLDGACKIQLDFMSASTALIMPTKKVVDKSARIMAPPTVKDRSGSEASLGDWNYQREWSALLRQLDRRDTSYRDC